MTAVEALTGAAWDAGHVAIRPAGKHAPASFGALNTPARYAGLMRRPATRA